MYANASHGRNLWKCLLFLLTNLDYDSHVFVDLDVQKQGMVKEGEEVALVQSGRQPIWRFQSTHNIQVRKV